MATQKSRRLGFSAVLLILKIKENVRFRDIHPSPDSGWRVNAYFLYKLVLKASVQYCTLSLFRRF
jgi:hypothetical protein